MYRMSLIVPVVAIGLLAGCASMYVPPISGPTAMLRIKPIGPTAYTWIHTYKNPGCDGPQAMGAIGDPETLTSAHTPKGMIDGVTQPDPNVVEHVIPAKQTTILFTQHGPHGGGYTSTCKLVVSFDALPAGQYEILYGYDAAQCFASVKKLMLVGDRVVREAVPGVKTIKGECSPYVF